MSMGLFKNDKLWKNVILPLIGTGGIGAIIIALLNHSGGHNVTTGNVSGNFAIGDHATIKINTNTSIVQITAISPISNQTESKLNSGILTPNQIVAEIRSARPAAQTAVEKTFEGASVDWILNLNSIYDDQHDTNGLIVMFLYKDDSGLQQTPVSVFVNKSKMYELSLLPSDAKVLVHGTIFEADHIGIRLKKASFTTSK